MIRTCGRCGVEFNARPSNVRQGKGKYCSPRCQYAALRGVPNVRDYKGDNAAYSTIHGWVSRNWGKASRCENPKCQGKSSWFEWANLDGSYRRVRQQWAELCRPCHRRYDIDNGLIGVRS